MKRIFIVTLICATAFSAFADTDGSEHGKKHRSNPFNAEYEAFLDEHRDTAIGDLTFGDVEESLLRMSIPMQESAYISRISSASRVVSGMGQFMAGDALSGTLFLAADILVAAGTIVGTYLLLPEELQFDQLDYFGTPLTQIKETWKTQAELATLSTAWPTLAVIAGGSILHKVFSTWSSKHATRLAKDNIKEGKVTFEPSASFMMSHQGRLGFGMGFRF